MRVLTLERLENRDAPSGIDGDIYPLIAPYDQPSDIIFGDGATSHVCEKTALGECLTIPLTDPAALLLPPPLYPPVPIYP